MKKILTFVVFIILLFTLYKITEPSPITSNFSLNAPRFYVLGLSEGKYEMLRLTDALERKDKYQFSLDKEKIILNVGDIHSIEILENSGDKQKIVFNYSNTYMSESIYEVSKNTITPIKYRIVSSMGHVGIYFMIFIASFIIAPIGSKLLIWLWTKRSQ